MEPKAQGAALTVRSLTAEDIDTVLKLDLELFDEQWSKEGWQREVSGNGIAYYYVLEKAGQFLGYGGYWLVFDEVQVTRLGIIRSQQGKGYGDFLVKALLAKAREQQAQVVTLEVRENNYPALKIYTKNGFQKAGIRPKYYANKDNAILMNLKLR